MISPLFFLVAIALLIEDFPEALIQVKHGKVNGDTIIQIAKNETI